MDSQKDRQTDRQVGGQMDRETHELTNRETDWRQTDRWQMDGQTGRWIDGE